MQAYQWQCHVCTHDNRPTHDKCEECGFPASARGDDILRERHARAVSAVAPADAPNTPNTANTTDAMDGLLAGLPLWRRVLAGIGLVVSGMGALWLRFSWTMDYLGTAFLMLAGGLLLAALLVRRGKAPAPPP